MSHVNTSFLVLHVNLNLISWHLVMFCQKQADLSSKRGVLHFNIQDEKQFITKMCKVVCLANYIYRAFLN